MSRVKLNDLDPAFKERIAQQPGGEGIRACFACKACTAACPIETIDKRYDPRKIIRMALLGMKKEVLEHLDSIGMEVIPTQRCPFDALAREEKELILTSVGGGERGLQNRAQNLNRISRITGGDPVMIVSNSIEKKRIGDTPVLKLSEIKRTKDVENLIQLIRERS